MVSVVIPTFNAEQGLPACLAALVPASVAGLVRQVIVADGGSTDRTLEIAEDAGADIVRSEKGRGRQLAAGAGQARGDWLLFLHADTVLQPGWEAAARAHMERSTTQEAAYFRFRFDARSWRARVVESGVHWRCRLWALPYGDQGLLIERGFYEELGGYRPLPLMEDVDMVDRIKARGRVVALDADAVTSAGRYDRDGYVARVLKNWRCILAWKWGVAPEKILEMYR